MRTFWTISAASLLVALAACETLDGPVPIVDDLLRMNRLTVEEERQLGAQVAAQVEEQETILDDPALQAYVDRIGQALVAGVERREVEYRFRVIDAPDTLNAFALPGGYMYLYTGLLLQMENEAELASVMGHEIAHVAAGHHADAMARAFNIQFVRDLLISPDRRAAATVANAFIGGVQLHFGREAEREADALGMNYMVRAGYHPGGMVSFMQKLQAADQAAGAARTPRILRSHPATQERIAAMTAQMQQIPAAAREAGQFHTERYQQEVLQRLR